MSSTRLINFKKRGGVTRDNSHQIEDTTSLENLELPSLISEMNTPQIGAAPEIPPSDFGNINWADVISMDSASHYVSPLTEEKDEDFETWCNSLFAQEFTLILCWMIYNVSLGTNCQDAMVTNTV